MEVSELRKCATAVYLAVIPNIADDISAKLKWAAGKIERLETRVKNQEATIKADLTIYSFDLQGKPHEDYVRYDQAVAVIEKLESKIKKLEDAYSDLDDKIGDMTF